MSKKGMTVVEWIYSVMIAAVIGVLILTMFTRGIPKLMTDSIEDVVAKDIGLAVMTISASPYDLIYSYDKNTEKYVVKVSDKKIQVVSLEGSGVYDYVPMKGVTVTESVISNVLSIPLSLENHVLKFSNENNDFSDFCTSIPLTLDETYLDVKIVIDETESGENLEKLNIIKSGIELQTSEANSVIRITKDNQDLILVLKTSNSDTGSVKYYENIDDRKTAWYHRIACYIQDAIKNKHSDILTNVNLEAQSTTGTITIDFGNSLTKKDSPEISPQDAAREIYNALKLGMND